MIEEVRPNCAELRQVVLIGTPDWDELVEAGPRRATAPSWPGCRPS